jgi:hypothetical protein
LGKALRESGHKRVPLPPHITTEIKGFNEGVNEGVNVFIEWSKRIGIRTGIAVIFTALACTGCGGGGGGGNSASASVSTPIKLVGEIIANPEQLASSSLQTNAGYSGNLTTSRAIAQAGKTNLLDLLFLTSASVTSPADAEKQLLEYMADNGDLLTSGVRVVVADEVYLNNNPLQPQWEKIQTAIALVRQHLPNVSVGVTVSPYATFGTFGKPNTLEFIKKTIALVDWVATDPYWFGDAATIPDLHAWSRDFHVLAKHTKPSVETWFIAQAFQFPQWDKVVFNQFIAEQLGYAEQYDHVLFFGWQFVSELDESTAGIHFSVDTRQLYKKYLK